MQLCKTAPQSKPFYDTIDNKVYKALTQNMRLNREGTIYICTHAQQETLENIHSMQTTHVQYLYNNV